MKFSELDLHSQVLAGTEAAGFENCMPVQEKVLPVSLTGSDVMVQSKTGSGKTAVFVITFLEEYLRKKDSGVPSACLVIAPTRELAQQIASDAAVLCSKIQGFHIGCFFGGVGYERQRKLLQMGCDMYVGTPGRLLEFMDGGELDASCIDTFVIDEADRMFDMGFFPDIKRIFRKLVPCTQRQTMLFSATLEMRVRELAWEYMNSPQEIELEPDSVTVDTIAQELYHVAKAEKFRLFLQLLASWNVKEALVFTNSRYMAAEIASRLKLNGYNADFLSGDLSQAAREQALARLRNGRTSILVATDVAARGLQIDDLPLVVNYDIPEDYENYVHRIGRTARAGKSGKAVTLADEEFVYGLEAIEKYIKMKIPVVWPKDLPDVEDLSLDKKWDVPEQRSARGTNRRSGSSGSRSKPAPRGRKGGKSAGTAAQKKQSFPEKQQYSEKRPASAKQAVSAGQASGSGRGGTAEQGAGKRQNNEAGARRKPYGSVPNKKNLGSMTEAERMEYYRSKYGFVPSAEVSAKSGAGREIAPDEALDKKPSAPDSVQMKEPAQTPDASGKKKGFFARLFGRKK